MKEPVTFINSGLAEVPFQAALAREIARRGHPVHAVAMGSRYTRLCRQTNCYTHVHDMVPWMRDHWHEKEELRGRARQMEERYAPPGLWQMLAADRRICRKGHDFNLQAACTQISFWEDHFQTHKPALLVSEVSHLHNYIPYVVGKRFGVPFAHLLAARIRGYTAIGDGPMEHKNIVQKNYTEFTQRELPEALRAQAQEYIEQCQQKAERAPHIPPVRKWYEDPIDIGTVGGFLQGVRDWHSWERHYNYILTSPMTKLHTWMAQRARRAWMKMWHSFDSLDDRHEPFVLFPLHLQPESSTMVRGQFFQDMLALVRNLSLSLPAGFRLYVKEHDTMFGQRPLSFFTALRELPNVVVVSPYENGPALIRRASAVATVTGTAGWEAALLGKPVFLFGNTFFDSYPGVDHVTDMTRLPDVLRQRLLQDFQPDLEERIRFVAAVFASIVPASMDAVRQVFHPDDYRDANKMADALLARAATQKEGE